MSWRGRSSGLAALALLVLAACTPHETRPETVVERPAPDEHRLLAVLVAGDDSISAFDNGAEYLADELASRGIPTSQIHRLSANPSQDRSVTPTSLRAIVAQLDALKPARDGGCLVFLTSHGVHDHGFYLVDDDPLLPATLDRALGAGCGQVPTVVIVSACYSGQFATGPMLKPNRIILTAARADRSSFGCEAGAIFTFFDECLLGSLPNAPDWRTVYERTRGCVTVRERQIDATPSEPQSYFGDEVAHLPTPFRTPPGADPYRIVFDESPVRYEPARVHMRRSERQRMAATLKAYAGARPPKALALVPNGLVVTATADDVGDDDPDAVARMALERCEFLSGGACILDARDNRMTELLPSGLAPFHPPILVRSGKLTTQRTPLIKARYRPAVTDYLALPGPKALAIDPIHGTLAVGTGPDSRNAAIRACAGSECVVYAEGDQVVLGWTY